MGLVSTTASMTYTIGGFPGTGSPKGITADLWDLSLETDTAAATYRAYWLYLDTAGTGATFVAGSDTLSEADALISLPAPDSALSVAGVYVAGPATDFNASTLSAQGTFTDGVPMAAFSESLAAGVPTLGPA